MEETKLGFIHIARNGGLSVKNFLSENYGEYFCLDNSVKCPKNFLILRDPLDRFFSLYYYWKNGSEIQKSNTPNYSINDFIYFLSKEECPLKTDHTDIETFRPQSTYIEFKDYKSLKNITVLLYKEDLLLSINILLNYFNIPINSNSKLKKTNCSIGRPKKSRAPYFAKNLNLFLRKKYGDDIDLYHKAINQPYLFNYVIN